MTPRPPADDLHVAPPRVRADDAFVAQLAQVAGAAHARERRRTERGSTLLASFAAASVAAVVVGGTVAVGPMSGAETREQRQEAPVGKPADRGTAAPESPTRAPARTVADHRTGRTPRPGARAERSTRRSPGPTERSPGRIHDGRTGADPAAPEDPREAPAALEPVEPNEPAEAPMPGSDQLVLPPPTEPAEPEPTEPEPAEPEPAEPGEPSDGPSPDPGQHAGGS